MHRLISLGLIAASAAALLYVLFLSPSAQWLQKFKWYSSRPDGVLARELVGFEFDKVFILGAYDLTVPMREQVFGSATAGYHWDYDPNSWTIVYKDKTEVRLVIRMNSYEWIPNRRSRLVASASSAKFKRVDEKSSEFYDCPRGRPNAVCILVTGSL